MPEMNTQQEQQEQNISEEENASGNTVLNDDQTSEQEINPNADNVENEDSDPSQIGTIPSDVDTDEALEDDDLDDLDDQGVDEDEDVPG